MDRIDTARRFCTLAELYWGEIVTAAETSVENSFRALSKLERDIIFDIFRESHSSC